MGEGEFALAAVVSSGISLPSLCFVRARAKGPGKDGVAVQICILAVGKTREKYLQLGLQEFKKRLAPYARLELINVAEERLADNPSPREEEQVMAREGERLLKLLKPGNTSLPSMPVAGPLPLKNWPSTFPAWPSTAGAPWPFSSAATWVFPRQPAAAPI